jgi:DNA-binding Lrp family transcriptional regulator
MKDSVGMLDDLDRRILQQMSRGISSYEELSRECNVTRSTVYRRVTLLEKRGFIQRITRTVVNYEKLDIVTLSFASRISHANLGKTLATLKSHEKVKLLWRTYGDHNLLFMVFCQKGEEGETIDEMTSILEKCAATEISVSVGFAWEKLDFTPFSDEVEEDKQLQPYYSEQEQELIRPVDLKFTPASKE